MARSTRNIDENDLNKVYEQILENIHKLGTASLRNIKKEVSKEFKYTNEEEKHEAKVDILFKLKLVLKYVLIRMLEEKDKLTLVRIPNDREKDEVIRTMHEFINNKLDVFIEHCQEVLPFFTEEDRASLDSNHRTANAMKFINLFSYLEENGFATPKSFSKEITLWSGLGEAYTRAMQASDELACDKMPAMLLMFEVVFGIKALQKNNEYPIFLLGSAISQYFSMHARGLVNVYLSSDKKNEPRPGFVATNHFWEAELPALLNLYEKNIVRDIRINIYNH